jgi:hypothetical protein
MQAVLADIISAILRKDLHDTIVTSSGCSGFRISITCNCLYPNRKRLDCLQSRELCLQLSDKNHTRSIPISVHQAGPLPVGWRNTHNPSLQTQHLQLHPCYSITARIYLILRFFIPLVKGTHCYSKSRVVGNTSGTVHCALLLSSKTPKTVVHSF